MSDAQLTCPTGSYKVPPLAGSGDFLSLVIPTYNEVENLRPLLEQLCPVLDLALGQEYEIIIADDDSPDGTYDAAVTLTQHCPRLRAMRRTQERGLATAVVRGWQAARGNILGVMDGDLQHPPAVLADELSEIRKGADLVIASRYVEHGSVGDWGLARRLLSRVSHKVSRLLLPELPPITDSGSGCFMVRRQLIQDIELHPSGYKLLIEVLARGRRGKLAEVPYTFQLRVHGRTKIASSIVQSLKHIIHLRRYLSANAKTSR